MIFPQALALTSATLEVAEGSETPIAAKLAMTAGNAPMEVEFDFRKTGKQIGEIAVDTDGGLLLLSENGAKLNIAGPEVALPPWDEYAGVYARFAELIAERAVDVDLLPLRLTMDALRRGNYVACEPFL